MASVNALRRETPNLVQHEASVDISFVRNIEDLGIFKTKKYIPVVGFSSACLLLNYFDK